MVSKVGGEYSEVEDSIMVSPSLGLDGLSINFQHLSISKLVTYGFDILRSEVTCNEP